jgi:hypothetical protein
VWPMVRTVNGESRRKPSACSGVSSMGLGRFERPTSRLSGGSRGERNTAACHKNLDRTRDLPPFRFLAARRCPVL